MELWNTNFLGVPACDGTQLAEINAYSFNSLYQEVTTVPGTVVKWSFAHRGRAGTDTVALRIGPASNGDTPQLTVAHQVGIWSSPAGAWRTYSGLYTVPAGQTKTRFEWVAIATATGSVSVGNLLDCMSVQQNPGASSSITPVDSDFDGTPDFLDTNSDATGGDDTAETGVDPLHPVDSDKDGISDFRDPIINGPDQDLDGVPNNIDIDDDGDGILDSVEGMADVDGDGLADQYDSDSDNDGVPDKNEGHDANSDGVADRVPSGTDTDGDGLDDAFDTDNGGTAAPLQDTDGDTIPNWRDRDDDGDGMQTGVNLAANADEDVDNDGNPINDNTDGDSKPNYLDTDDDGDGILTKDEVNYTVGVAAQRDSDGDGTPDHLDLDSDGDGITDAIQGGGDLDGDGITDQLDKDVDGDGIADTVEIANARPGTGGDTDGDGVPDYRDLDSDNDGINDVVEALGTDANKDGKADGTDANNDGIIDTALTAPDTDGDGKKDNVDLDSDNDSLPDLKEGGSLGTDADGDGVVDGPDTDGDGIMNSVDGAAGFGDASSPVTPNTDGADLPDYRDVDSNNDGVFDIDTNGLGKLDTGQGRQD